LPDGAIIHRSILQSDKPELSHKVDSQDNLVIEIRYLNQTFRSMFTAFREKLRIQEKERIKQDLAKGPLSSLAVTQKNTGGVVSPSINN
jgi:hypothetical protein